MYAVKLTADEFMPFIENLEGDRKVVAYAVYHTHVPEE